MNEILLPLQFADALDNSFLGLFVQIAAYITPYFLIPAAFKFGMGVFGNLAGMMNDKGRGLFDRQKKYRQGKRSETWAKTRAGARFNPDSKLTQRLGGNLVNRGGSHIGAGLRGRYGFGATGQAARANSAFTGADDMARESAAFKAQMNNEDAMAALAFGNDRAKLAQLKHFQDRNGNVDEAKLNGAMAAARTIGVDARSKTAAADALAKSGKVLSNRSEAEALYDAASGGNASLRGAVKGQYQWTSRQVGRGDIGRDSDRDSLKELSMGDIAKQKPKSLENLLGGGDLAGVGGPVDMPIMRAMRESSGAEQQHYADILFAAQHNPYTTPEQQGHIANALQYAEQNFGTQMTAARSNYQSKMAGPNNSSTPGAAGGGAPGSPAGP